MLIKDAGTMRNILATYYSVPTPHALFDDFAARLKWCLDHCNGNFTDVRAHDERIWYFEQEEDAVLFSLKWGER